MTISHRAANSGIVGTPVDGGTSGTVASAVDVLLNSLITVKVYRYQNPTSDPILLTDLVQNGTPGVGGVAVVSALSLDQSIDANTSGSTFLACAVFSCVVTTAGSLSFTLSGQPSSSYFWMVFDEDTCTSSFSTTAASRVESVNQGSGASGAPSAGNLSCSAAGGVFYGVLCTDTSAATTHTEGAGWSLVQESEDGAAHATGAVISRISAGALTSAPNWSAPTTVGWSAVGVSYKETGGASAVSAALVHLD